MLMTLTAIIASFYVALFGPPCTWEHHFCDGTPVAYAAFIEHREGSEPVAGVEAVSEPAAADADVGGQCGQ
jgi:hypothetical protein